ncbi:MAG: hypothetical protein NT062_09660 [Proteobacteria bacterium]|nr:hypothetical protein [Pseudomonadota bacterium]
MRTVTLALVTLGAALLPLIGCADAGDVTDDDADGLAPLPEAGKEDGQYRKGLPVNVDASRTGVWTVKNQWQDTTTTDAQKAGMAWPVDSKLTWDEKYAAWVGSLEWIDGVDGYSKTVKLTTPWGKTLPSPVLECAEMALFLRVTFAAWYQLPLQLEAMDGGKLVYFGHFGVRTAAGRYPDAPEYAVRYKDYSNTNWQAQWPSDSALRKRRVAGGEDNQNELREGAVFGEYLDQIHVNKRAAHFTIMVLDYLGSMNLADSANTFNLVPESVRSGDVLLERWQKNGIGHTLVVKDVTTIGEGNYDVTTISGSMPRRQGKQQSGIASKGYFTSQYTGGEGMNFEGDLYAKLGGGLKRFRVAKPRNGFWTNTWMAGDEAHWINSTDVARIGARPARFESILGQVSPEQQKTELLAQITDARRHLTNYPASCSARERREDAFRDLYDIEERAFGRTRGQVDADYRDLEDYVFAELEYSQSKTCCWNSTTAAMHDIVLAEAKAEEAAAEANMTCVAPVVFRAQADGYARWATYAASIGRAAEWKAWSEDEPCAQRATPADVVSASEATNYCELTP